MLTTTHVPPELLPGLRELTDVLAGQLGLPPDSADSSSGESYRIRVANTPELRRRAYALAYRVYSGRGYVKNSDELIVDAYDREPLTLTLLAEDEQGRAAGTATLICDGDCGLPSDAIFGVELEQLRASGRRLTEITRLAIATEHQHSKLLLLRLFNFLHLYAYKIRCADACVIEINPHHAQFYKRRLRFEPLGGERPCPRVQGAPALLLLLNYALVERAQHSADGARTLYPQFYSGAPARAAQQFLAGNQTPMSAAEAHSFGLNRIANAKGALAQ